MATILDPNPQGTAGGSVSLDSDQGYKYPYGLDLRPGSKLHQRILQEVNNRAKESSAEMSKRFPSWKKIDRSLTAYVPADTYESALQVLDERKPISIVIPYTYATLETLLTYFVAAFLESPIFKFEGNSPEDIVGAFLMERIVDTHCNNFKVALGLHTMFRDAFAYGIGPVATTWETKWGFKETVKERGFFSQVLGRFLNMGQETSRERTVLAEGNSLKNLDPYLTLLDPNVAAHNTQKGEYIGWIEETNRMALLTMERDAPDNTFNVKFLGDFRSSTYKSQYNKNRTESGRSERFGGTTWPTSTTTQPCDVVWMYVTLIPKEWELGPETYPEKWFFGVIGDKIVCTAVKLGLNHDMYPTAVAAPEFDGYSSTPIGRMEITYGMQHHLDFLMSCYDAQTEVLTKRGWVMMADATDDDEVATVDPQTKKMWFERPIGWVRKHYTGPMVCFLSSRMDICVTPNHWMYGYYRHTLNYEFKRAAMLMERSEWDEFKTIGNVLWDGVGASDLIFDGIEPKKYVGYEQRYKPAVIKSLVLAGFLGWFLSEGSVTGTTVSIKQSKKENFEDIDGIMEAMPFHVTKYYDENKEAWSWSISDKRLASWVRDNCYVGGTHSEHKAVPAICKEWDAFTIQVLFDRCMAGDGHWFPGYRNLGAYGTTSKHLIDGMQDLALKLGYFTHYRSYVLPSGKTMYTLNICTTQTRPTIAARNIYKKDYDGMVYCFENSTHLTVTRRNGKIAVQGQSHMTNVRKAINDMLIVDPSLINMEDLKSPSPGKLIRMRKSAWGRGVENAVKQLQVVDITAKHMQDATQLIEMMRQTTGAQDVISGVRRQSSERVTATEASGDRNGALSRLAKAAKVVSLQALWDIGYMFASNTQQLMSKPVYVKTVGLWEDVLAKEYGIDAAMMIPQMNPRMLVNPKDLSVAYDLIIKDGSVMGGENPQVWAELFRTIASSPQLFQNFDVVRIFKHVARVMGAKDVNEFVLKAGPVQAQLMGDQQVASQAQAGNLVPVTQGGE